MKKSIIEVIKANKKAIIKKALIVGGTAVGLGVAAIVLSKKDEEDDEDLEVMNEDTEESEEI